MRRMRNAYNSREIARPIARMEMPRLRVRVESEIAQKLASAAEKLYPDQGRRAASRLARDSIKRYLRYCNGRDRSRSSG